MNKDFDNQFLEFSARVAAGEATAEDVRLLHLKDPIILSGEYRCHDHRTGRTVGGIAALRADARYLGFSEADIQRVAAKWPKAKKAK